MFFGYNLVRHGDFWIPVSDLEKTLIDMVYFKVNIHNEPWPEILANIDTRRLGEYLKKYDKKFQKLMHNLISENGK